MIAAFIMLLPLQGEGGDGDGFDGDNSIQPPHAPILTCSARSDTQVGTARRAQSMLCEFPASPLTLPLKGRESFMPTLEVLP